MVPPFFFATATQHRQACAHVDKALCCHWATAYTSAGSTGLLPNCTVRVTGTKPAQPTHATLRRRFNWQLRKDFPRRKTCPASTCPDSLRGCWRVLVSVIACAPSAYHSGSCRSRLRQYFLANVSASRQQPSSTNPVPRVPRALRHSSVTRSHSTPSPISKLTQFAFFV